MPLAARQRGKTQDLLQRDLGVVIPSLRTQVTAYRLTLADPTPPIPRVKRAPVDALYIVWGGANDSRDAVQQARRRPPQPAMLSTTLRPLSATCRALEPSISLSLISLTWDGRLSMSHAVPAVQVATALSTAFNNALGASTLQHLDSTPPGAYCPPGHRHAFPGGDRQPPELWGDQCH